MSQLVFQNEEGTLCIGGGASGAWRMTNVSGLGMPAKTFQMAVLSSEAGQRTLSERKEVRVITISGDIRSGEMPVEARLSKAVRILDRPGWLTVRTAAKSRRIWARCSTFEPGKRIGSYREFQMQFRCDSPYFEECGKNTIALFEREKRIKNTFSFPHVLSRRTSKGCVINRGDVQTEPVFEIYFGVLGGEDTMESLELVNRSNGQSLCLSYAAEGGETVTVDIPNRKIYNQSGENLISSLSENSFLSNFVLNRGKNELEVIHHTTRDIGVVCRFSDKYLEAVY